MKKIGAIFLYCTVLSLTSACAETTIQATVDKTSITTDQTITYRLVIASSENRIPRPKLPKFTGFQIISQSQSSRFSVATNVPTSKLIYAYILSPLTTGSLKIPASQITINGQTYTSSEFNIEVTSAKRTPVFPEKSPPVSKPTLPQTDEAQTTL